PRTRTRTSFEVPEKRLSADTLSIAAAQSSGTKGATLLHTVRNLDAMAPDMNATRHAPPGAPRLLARACRSARIHAAGGLPAHPGPMNRGVEIDSEVADGPYSVILEQVTNGVAVRMAVLYLLAGQEAQAD